MIQVEGLKKSFGSNTILNGIDFNIEKGQTVAIVGPSGTGKSVLLKIITGLLKQDSGNVYLFGEDTSKYKPKEAFKLLYSRIGILFQSAALLDYLNVFDNIAFPLRWDRKLTETEIIKKVYEVLELVELRSYAEVMPQDIPMGVKKGVGIARALVRNPEIILFDEPNTGLDPKAGQDLYDLINRIRDHAGVTGIVISHEIPEVFQIAQRTIMLYDGKVVQDSESHKFPTSENPVVYQFVNGITEGPIKIS